MLLRSSRGSVNRTTLGNNSTAWLNRITIYLILRTTSWLTLNSPTTRRSTTCKTCSKACRRWTRRRLVPRPTMPGQPLAPRPPPPAASRSTRICSRPSNSKAQDKPQKLPPTFTSATPAQVRPTWVRRAIRRSPRWMCCSQQGVPRPPRT